MSTQHPSRPTADDSGRQAGTTANDPAPAPDGPSASAATRFQSASAGMPRTSTCGTTRRMRARISFSNPFTTESTVMSDATPSAIPASDTAAMKEMKLLRLPPRRARV